MGFLLVDRRAVAGSLQWCCGCHSSMFPAPGQQPVSTQTTNVFYPPSAASTIRRPESPGPIAGTLPEIPIVRASWPRLASRAADHRKPSMNRAAAWNLLNEYTRNPGLIKHMLAVEAAMRAYAKKLAQDEERWGIVGLLHDFDYEQWPDPPDHPLKGAAILQAQGYPEDVIYAIKSHADYLPDCPRVHLIDKALYACDELSGLITAAALVRPAGITDLTAQSVKKKMKSKGFARTVNRDDIVRGAADFGVDLTEHIQFVVEAMKTIAGDLGLLQGTSEGEAS